MPILPYKASDFDPLKWGKEFQGENFIDCTWAELIWAALTVGKKSISDVLKYKKYSYFECVFRITMIYATLKESEISNKLIQTEIYDSLDPSEKNALSYFHGLVTSKLLAEKLLSTTWLMHLDVYYKDYIIAMDPGTKSRPDFIGKNNSGDWIVLEAKGRSNNFDKNAQLKAKKQTEKLKTIDGAKPFLRAAVQSYITSSGYFRARIDDPEEIAENATNIQVDEDRFIKSYYRLITDLINQYHLEITEQNYNNSTYLMIEIPNVGITIGISKSIYNLLISKKATFEKLNSLLIAENLISDSIDDKATFLGKDSVLIITKKQWNIENMVLETEQRE